jgi:hypothetical protein
MDCAAQVTHFGYAILNHKYIECLYISMYNAILMQVAHP